MRKKCVQYNNREVGGVLTNLSKIIKLLKKIYAMSNFQFFLKSVGKWILIYCENKYDHLL